MVEVGGWDGVVRCGVDLVGFGCLECGVVGVELGLVVLLEDGEWLGCVVVLVVWVFFVVVVYVVVVVVVEFGLGGVY